MTNTDRPERPDEPPRLGWFELALRSAVALIIIVAAIVFAAVLWSMR